MPRYLKLKIEILQLETRVWRQILVTRDMTYFELHLAIQSFGW